MVKLILSEEAYTKLKLLLDSHNKDYSCIRFSYNKGCCKSPKVDIYLDDLNNKKDYTIQNIKDIPFIFDTEVNTNLQEIELIYKSSSFMLKTTSSKEEVCTTCIKCSH